MSYITGNIPTFYAYLKEEFLYNNTRSGNVIECEVFAFNAIQRRAPSFNVMTEYGSVHNRVPLHYLVHKKEYKQYPLDYLSIWDCYSYHFNAVRYDYLKNSKVDVLMKDKTLEKGEYLFTIDWADNYEARPGSYSEQAYGHKTHHIIKLDSGMFAAQPNNRLWFYDGGAFINPSKRPQKIDWLIFQKDFSCEQTGWKWDTRDDETVYYQFEESKLDD